MRILIGKLQKKNKNYWWVYISKHKYYHLGVKIKMGALLFWFQWCLVLGTSCLQSKRALLIFALFTILNYWLCRPHVFFCLSYFFLCVYPDFCIFGFSKKILKIKSKKKRKWKKNIKYTFPHFASTRWNQCNTIVGRCTLLLHIRGTMFSFNIVR